MEILKLAIILVQLTTCATLMTVIVLQSGKNSGLSVLSGKTDTFLSRNKQKSRDARLALATKWVAGTFLILTVVLNLI